jgi:hypothetical protein
MQHFWHAKENMMKLKTFTDFEAKYGERVAAWLIVAMVVYLIIAQ